VKDDFSIPKQMIAALNASSLTDLLAYLNRTRRRTYPFAFNGTQVLTTRRWARDTVKAELAGRKPPTDLTQPPANNPP
jgi:hypothetical protein